MKQLSSNGTPLPRLVMRTSNLAPDTVALLDRKQLAHPSARIAESFWSVTEQLHEMLTALDFSGLDREALVRRKRSVLSGMELLMHRSAAVNDYLGGLMRVLLPSEEGQKNRDADAAKRRLDAHVNRIYKMPINMIKHDGFSLSWIEMSLGDLSTHGYMVAGPIGDGVHGPVKFRRPGRDDPEGYSFALTLREVLPALYQMCAIAEEAVEKAGLLAPVAEPSIARDIRAGLLTQTLELLNQLPFRGFPDEHQVRVPVFSLQEGAVMARTSPLRKLPGSFQIQSELRSVRKGGTYKVPYWTSTEPTP